MPQSIRIIVPLEKLAMMQEERYSNGVMSPVSTEIEELRQLLSPERHEERLRQLTADQKALYERILKRREKIGPVGFDINQAIRELRDNG